MQKVAKLFQNGRSQAVRLPAEFRFRTKQVFIRQDPATGDVILSERPDSWQDFFRLRDAVPAAERAKFNPRPRPQIAERGDPFEAWEE
jgi:antitoxin VapB